MKNLVTVEEVRYVAHRLAKEFMEWGEPIPAFETRRGSILESCLETPFQRFGGKFLYMKTHERAAMLFYFMIKNHPFQNGNKRIAVVTLLYFLSKSGRWLNVDNQELYNFAKWVAESNPKLKDATVDAIQKFIMLYIVTLPEGSVKGRIHT
ncbi:MAG TPA: type II toxin-antitoxin system death-on-curing family toxin [Candidatus Paceibacterota bacterium]